MRLLWAQCGAELKQTRLIKSTLSFLQLRRDGSKTASRKLKQAEVQFKPDAAFKLKK